MEAAMTRILIADDNQDIVDILTRFARKEDLKVDAASDGQEALDLFGKKDYDLILLDIMMPKRMAMRSARPSEKNPWSPSS